MRQVSEEEAIFIRKLAEAQRCLDEIERTLQPLGQKLEAAKLQEEVDVNAEVDQVEALIWRHNDAMESARDAWLRGDFGGNTFNRLTEARNPASLWLPMFVDKQQAERAKAQWKQIGKRLKQRITFLDNVIFAMEIAEQVGTFVSIGFGVGVLVTAVAKGGAIVLVKTAAKMAVGAAISKGVGMAVEAGLRAAGASEETIGHVQHAAEIVTWLLILRRTKNSLPKARAGVPRQQEDWSRRAAWLRPLITYATESGTTVFHSPLG